MKLGIMQPYFFPYQGYFALIVHTDEWVVFDTPQFDRKGWMHRNRILKRGGDWKYVSASVVKAPLQTPIHDIHLQDISATKDELLRNIDFYRDVRAPYFSATEEIIHNAFDTTETSLVRLNVRILDCICAYIRIPFRRKIFTEMNLTIKTVEHPGQWALRIAEAMGASDYVNPPGGREIFDPQAFQKSGIALHLLHPNLPPYTQTSLSSFVPGLSILDSLMFCSPAEIGEQIADYRVETLS